MSEIKVFFGDISEYCYRTGYAVNTNKDDNEPNDGELPYIKGVVKYRLSIEGFCFTQGPKEGGKWWCSVTNGDI